MFSHHVKPRTKREASRAIKNADSKDSDTVTGVNYATVTNDNDPMHLARLKVRLDYMKEDEESDWIPPMGGYQGNGFGSTFDTPMVDDRVRIQYILGNASNMAYSPGFFSDAEEGDLISSASIQTPTGEDDGKHDASKNKRRNIWKSMSGWLLDIIEGQAVKEKWQLLFQSPTARDMVKWFTPLHEKSGRPYSVMFLKIDDLMEFWDESSPDGEKAVFRWEYLLKLIELQMHKGGRIVIRDHKGSSLSWDDETQMLELKMPEQKVFLKDRAGGNFTYDSASSKISMKLIDNLEAIAKSMRFGVTESFEVYVGTVVTPDVAIWPPKPGNGGKFTDVKDPLEPPPATVVNGEKMFEVTAAGVFSGGPGGQPSARVGDTVEVLVPGIGICFGTITSGSSKVFDV